MARGMETVNISKAATTTNMFYLFFHGGKAAIVPFLTLFFRLVGLTPLEAGLIIAAKTLTGLIWAPLWARCATAYSRHRFVLMLSLFMMMLTYLSLPALYTQVTKPEDCQPNTLSRNDSGVGVNGMEPWVNHLLHPEVDNPEDGLTKTTTPVPTITPVNKAAAPTTVPSENLNNSQSTAPGLSGDVPINHTSIPNNVTVPSSPPHPTISPEEELQNMLKGVLDGVDILSPNFSADALFDKLQEKAPGNFTREDARAMYEIILGEKDVVSYKQYER